MLGQFDDAGGGGSRLVGILAGAGTAFAPVARALISENDFAVDQAGALDRLEHQLEKGILAGRGKLVVNRLGAAGDGVVLLHPLHRLVVGFGVAEP